MKIIKKITTGLLGTLLIGTVAFAATPAEIYSDVTGVTTQEAYSLRQEEGITFGELAEENGVFQEFVDKMVEDKISRIEDRVDQGSLTQEEADTYIAKIKENAENCDPSNSSKLGQKMGLNWKNGNGNFAKLGKRAGMFGSTSAEIYSEVAGITTEEAYSLRQEEGKTFGELAEENGVLEEFVDKMVEDKITKIEDKVDQGSLTQEEADTYIAKIKENAENCDPSNPAKLGQKIGLNNKNGNGNYAKVGRGNGLRKNGCKALGIGNK